METSNSPTEKGHPIASELPTNDAEKQSCFLRARVITKHSPILRPMQRPDLWNVWYINTQPRIYPMCSFRSHHTRFVCSLKTRNWSADQLLAKEGRWTTSQRTLIENIHGMYTTSSRPNNPHKIHIVNKPYLAMFRRRFQTWQNNP